MSIDAPTIVALWAAQAKASADKTAMLVKRDGQYHPVTWSEIRKDVNRTAAALEKLGVEHGDRVVLISRNRYEWIVCDLAIQLAGGTHVPVHASLAGPQIAYQIVDSGAKVVILSGPDQAEKLVDQVYEIRQIDEIRLARSLPKAGGPVRRFALVGPDRQGR